VLDLTRGAPFEWVWCIVWEEQMKSAFGSKPRCMSCYYWIGVFAGVQRLGKETSGGARLWHYYASCQMFTGAPSAFP